MHHIHTQRHNPTNHPHKDTQRPHRQIRHATPHIHTLEQVSKHTDRHTNVEGILKQTYALTHISKDTTQTNHTHTLYKEIIQIRPGYTHIHKDTQSRNQRLEYCIFKHKDTHTHNVETDVSTHIHTKTYTCAPAHPKTQNTNDAVSKDMYTHSKTQRPKDA